MQVGKLWGFIDSTGRQVIPPTFEAAYYFREGIANVEIKDDYIFINRDGAVVARGFALLEIISEGRIPVRQNGKNGYLDLHGNIAIPLIYDSVGIFHNGLAPVRSGDKWGYIDRDGNQAIPFRFDSAREFGSGLAPVRIGKEAGFIDRSGKFVFHLTFEQASGFLTGDADEILAADSDVSRFWTADDQFGYVNTSGKVIWGPTTDQPDHPPLLGWSKEDEIESCKGFPESVRKQIESFPKD